MIDANLLLTYSWNAIPPLPPEVWGTWIPRAGDNGRFVVEVPSNVGALVTVEVFQKNYGDVGDGVTAGVSVVFNGVTGRQTMEVIGAKEVIRFKVKIERGAVPKSDVGWFLIRFLQPVWFESVKA